MPEQTEEDSYGHGYGHGYGSGDGFGRGFGHGHGYGYGHGHGDGYGDGGGSGAGHGYGGGHHIGKAGEHDVVLSLPWQYAKVGCHCHSLKFWRKNWERIAREEHVSISQAEVEKLISPDNFKNPLTRKDRRS